MKTILICHQNSALNRDVLPRWMASFSDVVGLVLLKDTNRRLFRRLRSEVSRSGILRLCDILAFKLYYYFCLSKKDQDWIGSKATELAEIYSVDMDMIPTLIVDNPNSLEVAKFVSNLAPDIMLARCKVILKKDVYDIPKFGTFVMHPGICPEYRNSHGCFWALANDDLNNVGMTLLKIDDGIDTGEIYGYYTCDFDSVNDTHIVIQHKVVFDNLSLIGAKLQEIYSGSAFPIGTAGRKSAIWGQPWLSKYLNWKRKARLSSK